MTIFVGNELPELRLRSSVLIARSLALKLFQRFCDSFNRRLEYHWSALLGARIAASFS